MTDYILQTEHIYKYFSGKRGKFSALEDINIALSKGECLGIVGESGSGKSTLARIVCCLEEPSEGKLFLENNDITNLTAKEQRKIYQKIQMVFQNPTDSFDPRCTLHAGISEGLKNLGRTQKEILPKIETLMDKCGLPAELGKRYPYEVSGGQCQRAALVRALAMEPEILVCDEITSNLDVSVQKQLMEFLQELKKTDKMSFLFICHDLALVQQFCDRVVIMQKGKIVEAGSTEKIISMPETEYTKLLMDAAF